MQTRYNTEVTFQLYTWEGLRRIVLLQQPDAHLLPLLTKRYSNVQQAIYVPQPAQNQVSPYS
jgi:hypothetical protein